jgi:hypothetical protein
MACVWCLHGNGRADGDRNFNDPEIFYIHFISHYGVAGDRIFLRSVLDECEAVYI